MGMKKSMVFLFTLFVIASDQLTKSWALSHLTPYVSVPVFSMLSWTLAFNSGAAFSFLADAGKWHTWFFTVFSSFVSIGLCVWIVRLKSFTQSLALGLILGGAVGNLIDRIRMGYVVDFIDIFYGSFHWPAFNIADMAICLGGLWMTVLWFGVKEYAIEYKESCVDDVQK